MKGRGRGAQRQNVLTFEAASKSVKTMFHGAAIPGAVKFNVCCRQARIQGRDEDSSARVEEAKTTTKN